MKDIALQVTGEAKEQKLHALREYLQNYILFLMQKTGMYMIFSGIGQSTGNYCLIFYC
jgi:hypothetical protein